MGIRTWWASRRRRRTAEAEHTAREQYAAEVAAARKRVRDLARREREERDRQQVAWAGPTRIDGLPLLTYGQAHRYRTGGVR